MKKAIAYIIGIAGLILIALSYSFIRDAVGIALPETIGENYVLIVGVVLAIVGAYLGFKKSGGEEKAEEVPIYKGEKVVGYRRH